MEGVKRRNAHISIHAPLARRDHKIVGWWIFEIAFQSTRLLRGATFAPRLCSVSETFQSTRLLRGATWEATRNALDNNYFNPRASCEARR